MQYVFRYSINWLLDYFEKDVKVDCCVCSIKLLIKFSFQIQQIFKLLKLT